MSEITWFQKARLEAIETLSYWRGQINTRDIMEIFGVSRVIALRDIHRYMKGAPNNLLYESSKKSFFITPSFTNELTSGEIDEWMKLNSNICENIVKPRFEINPSIVRPTIDAIKKEQGVIILYRSMKQPEGRERLIFPHTLVYSGFRWHIRAWCSLRKEFRDFNFSRISKVTASNNKNSIEYKKKEDSNWSLLVDIQLKANPNMSEFERSLIEDEFNMANKQLVVTTRAALVMYTLQSYQVDPKKLDDIYNQRLVLDNLKKLSPYLW